ncbi:MAG TPA: hypothetical protein VFM82_03715 [Flavobacteriaceae bacterium]|nr:hypothetical protein [Flavobacteriaceae bacterium]
MKLVILTIFLCFFTNLATAQIDKSLNLPIPSDLQNPMTLPNDSEPVIKMPKSSPSLTNPDYRTGIKVPSMLGRKKEKKENIMSTETGLLTRTIDFKPGYLEKFRDPGGKGNTKTQYLGEFSSNGRFVEIYCRDHEYVDGDRIQILHNGDIVAPNEVLLGSFQPVLITLEKGNNRIEFKALNEGSSSPNTAEFIVYDELGNVITHNRWNLATGVKASILIHKP